MNSGLLGFPNILGLLRGTNLKVLGKAGATAGAGLAGGTTSGAPTSGQFDVGDAIVSQSDGSLWICTVSGSPGTFVQAGFANPMTGSQDLIVGGASGAAGRLAVGSNGQVLSVSGGSVAWASPAGASLTTASSQLSSDVTMTSANTYYDGPSVSLAAGTWLLVGHIGVSINAGATNITAKLWDGTTAYDSAEGLTGSVANYACNLTVCADVTPSSTTTYKISAAAGGAAAKIKASCPDNGAGNTAATLVALKVA